MKYILELLIIYSTKPNTNATAEKETSTDLNPNGALNIADKALKLLLTTVRPCQALMELYQQYENGMTQVPVSWKKWHQYGKDVELFSQEHREAQRILFLVDLEIHYGQQRND